MYNNREYNGTNIKTNTTTTIFTGKGTLQAVTVNATAAGSVVIIDGSQIRASLKPSIVEGTYWYNMCMATGLIITTVAASDITVTWTQ